MAELDRRLRLAIVPAGDRQEEPAANGGGPEEAAVVENSEAPALREPDAAADLAAPPEEGEDGAPEVLPAMDRDGEAAEGAVDELPAAEELARRLSPEVRAALDELFRAKWTGVKRLRPGDLKAGR